MVNPGRLSSSEDLRGVCGGGAAPSKVLISAAARDKVNLNITLNICTFAVRYYVQHSRYLSK